MLRKAVTVCSLVVAFVFFASLVVAQDTNTGGPASFASGGSAPAAATPGTTGGSVQAIQFDLSPGTGAPPPTLGGFSMTPVPSPGAPACTHIQPPLPTSGGGTIGIAPVDTSQHRCINAGWNTWSHGYVGDVYYTGSGQTSQTLTFPSGTGAVYFYVEPDLFAHDFTVVAQPGDVSSGAFSVDGSGGAKYVGVFSSGGTVTGVTISSDTPFAVGELGWASAVRCDPNGDGLLDAKDVVTLLRLLLQGTPLPVGGSGDCNGDGKVNFADVLAILKRS